MKSLNHKNLFLWYFKETDSSQGALFTLEVNQLKRVNKISLIGLILNKELLFSVQFTPPLTYEEIDRLEAKFSFLQPKSTKVKRLFKR